MCAGVSRVIAQAPRGRAEREREAGFSASPGRRPSESEPAPDPGTRRAGLHARGASVTTGWSVEREAPPTAGTQRPHADPASPSPWRAEQGGGREAGECGAMAPRDGGERFAPPPANDAESEPLLRYGPEREGVCEAGSVLGGTAIQMTGAPARADVRGERPGERAEGRRGPRALTWPELRSLRYGPARMWRGPS